MRAIAPQINPAWVHEIIVVDGGSTDGTVEYAKELGYKVVMQKRLGSMSGALMDAFDASTGDYLITFSPDGNSVADRIPALIEKLKEGYDMVIVSRYLGGHKSEDDDWVTAFGNKLFTTTINILFGGSYTDTLVIFRGYRRDILTRLGLSEKDVAGLEPQLSILSAVKKLKVGEIYGAEPPRIGGARKMQPLKHGFAILVLIVREWFFSIGFKRSTTKVKA